MGKKSKGQMKQDLSSFMSILIMTIGALVIVLCANTLIIASNPDNLEITSLFSADSTAEDGDVGQPMFENTAKEPAYIDVWKDYLVIYPGEVRVLKSDLEREGNAFEFLLRKIEANKDHEYVVMLLRPYSAVFARRIRTIVRDRGIDLGQELYELDKPVNYTAARTLDAEGMAEKVAAAVEEQKKAADEEEEEEGSAEETATP